MIIIMNLESTSRALEVRRYLLRIIQCCRVRWRGRGVLEPILQPVYQELMGRAVRAGWTNQARTICRLQQGHANLKVCKTHKEGKSSS